VRTIADTTLTEAEREVLERFVEALREELGDELLAVWLYGSRARGEGHDESDLDVLVLTRNGRRDRERVISVASDTALDAAQPMLISAHTNDPEWLAGRRDIQDFYIQEVDRDKVILYGDPHQ
jgi:predicted nucleotidyltransferase